MHMRGKTICEFTVIIEDLGFEADVGFELNLGSLEQRSLSRSPAAVHVLQIKTCNKWWHHCLDFGGTVAKKRKLRASA